MNQTEKDAQTICEALKGAAKVYWKNDLLAVKFSDQKTAEEFNSFLPEAILHTYPNRGVIVYVNIENGTEIEELGRFCSEFITSRPLPPFEELPPLYAGELLRKLRERRGMLQKELATAIDSSQSIIAEWESATHAVDQCKLGELIHVLSPSNQEARQFFQLVRPNVILPKNWLEKQIAAQKWVVISLPALDEEWLEAQAKELQAGLLLHDLRMRRNISTEKLEIQIGSTIEGWELGKYHINQCKLGELIHALSPSNQEARRFFRLVRPNVILPEHWLEKQIGAQKWELISFPALDDEWLEAQPLYLRGGLLLHDLRRQRSLAQKELGKKNTIARWENGKLPINIEKIEEIAAPLKLSPEQYTRFRRVVEESNTGRREEQRMRHPRTQVGATTRTKQHPEFDLDSGKGQAIGS